jgi:hypothetical protein
MTRTHMFCQAHKHKEWEHGRRREQWAIPNNANIQTNRVTVQNFSVVETTRPSEASFLVMKKHMKGYIIKIFCFMWQRSTPRESDVSLANHCTPKTTTQQNSLLLLSKSLQSYDRSAWRGPVILRHCFCNDFNSGKIEIRKSAPLYRHWGSVQSVRPIGGVEV